MIELRAKAERLQRSEEWGAEALSINERLLAVAPGDQPATVRAARCLRAMGRLDESGILLVRLLAKHPDNAVARSQLRRTMVRREARARAEELLAQGSHALVGALESAKTSETELDFQVEGRRLMARRERSVQAACALAAAQRAVRDLDGARNTYEWALAQDRDPRSNAMAHVGFAAVRRDARQYRDAERILRQVIAVDGTNRFAQLGLAAVLMDLAEHLGQREVLDECRSLLASLWKRAPGDLRISAAYGRLTSLGG